MTQQRIYCYGDSNAAGAELKITEKPFVHWVANELQLSYQNFATNGASLGLILHKIVTTNQLINKNDIVLITIPPDTRWYDENEQHGFYSLQNYMRDDYLKFLNKKSLEWFSYHHALFVYAIQKILDDIGCYYIMTHVYGKIDELKKYNLSIDFNKFLSNLDMLNLLNEGKISIWDPYPKNTNPEHRYDHDCPGGWYHNKSSIYFKGTNGHPNELGHKRIAELILEKYKIDQK